MTVIVTESQTAIMTFSNPPPPPPPSPMPDAATIQARLEAVAGAGNVSVTGPIAPYLWGESTVRFRIAFQGALANTPIPRIRPVITTPFTASTAGVRIWVEAPGGNGTDGVQLLEFFNVAPSPPPTVTGAFRLVYLTIATPRVELDIALQWILNTLRQDGVIGKLLTPSTDIYVAEPEPPTDQYFVVVKAQAQAQDILVSGGRIASDCLVTINVTGSVAEPDLHLNAMASRCDELFDRANVAIPSIGTVVQCHRVTHHILEYRDPSGVRHQRIACVYSLVIHQ
jgi:hypothetical protein